MNLVEPIKNKNDIKNLENYLKLRNIRNRLIFVFGINTGLLILMMLKIKIMLK